MRNAIGACAAVAVATLGLTLGDAASAMAGAHPALADGPAPTHQAITKDVAHPDTTSGFYYSLLECEHAGVQGIESGKWTFWRCDKVGSTDWFTIWALTTDES